jgi:hypothetical protein
MGVEARRRDSKTESKDFGMPSLRSERITEA